MDVFQLRDTLIDDYKSYVTSFMAIRDQRIRQRVETALSEGRLWPEARIGLNPAFEPGGWIDDLVAEGLLHEQARQIFCKGKSSENPFGEPMRLHRHQVDAIRAARAGLNYVLTTGTGSGKSLAYIVPIVDHVLRHGSGNGIKAIVVYPMNALANSQLKELDKFLGGGSGRPAVRFARYTGQENADERHALQDDPPDVLLTNYVMLELILTRVGDRRLVQAAKDLRFLVLDEMHTYRGRQGADVALLVRRVREACQAERLQCVGTSATLSTEGTFAEQRATVAQVASLLFGAEVLPESVIGETLRRTTPPADHADPAWLRQLRDRLDRPTEPTTYEELVADPLSSWIESTFGVMHDGERLVRVPPRPIRGSDGAATELAGLTGVDVDRCVEVIRRQLMAGFRIAHPDTGFPAFAFRLHQFISKGDTVFASPEPADRRHLTLNGQRFVPGHRDRVLLPLSFCRLCGQEYYTVRKVVDEKGTRFTPRDLGEQQGDDGDRAGFLVLSDGLWPDDPAEVLERVPEDWLEETVAGPRLRRDARELVPSPLRVGSSGALVDADGTPVWWVPAPLRLCLRCGASYDARSRSDLSKLTTLGSEGRSTATTVLSLAAVRYLRADRDLKPEARKLLSFTDNRQDASLQAGHFNDFVQTTLLRAAVRHAVAIAGPDGLEHDRVAAAVFAALDLPFDQYAVDPLVEFAARAETERTMRDVIGYLVYRDLRRGWRITSPNLEQVGLLRFDYHSLDELCAAEHVWAATHPALATAEPAVRERVARVLLDYLRRELAIKVDYLDQEFQGRLLQRSNQRLSGPWALDDSGRLEYAGVVVPRSQQPGDFRGWTYLSARSGLGRFLRRSSTFPNHDGRLTLADTSRVLDDLFAALRRAGLVEQVVEARDGTPGYQLPAAALRWRPGDGTAAYHDPIRMPTAPAESLGPNRFFIDLYGTVARDLVGVEAREHTAQVPYEQREERERRFTNATLPVLYSSPTMELGVDIAELNVVNLRNVPPTPANYAQRSGRAGRSGQPALVFTYASAGSPHDQWFFHRPQLMVSGQVTTPRLDLTNEDLLRAHVQAVWLAKSGLSLGGSLTEVLDVDHPSGDPVITDRVNDVLRDPTLRVRARDAAQQVIADLVPMLEDTTWWGPTWLEDVLNNIPQSFAAATQRWKGLYRSAKSQFEAQNAVIVNHAASSQAKDQAKRLRREAEAQLDLLTASTDTRNQSDFYSYRYFASEGFLPGYSFPRLPLAAFIPGRRSLRSEGDFVQRPRFLAISEFGPRSLVYHEGNRYEINRVILPVSEHTDAQGDPILTTTAKRCDQCGYFHQAIGGIVADVCERCAAPLPPALPDLFRLQNVATRRRDRITADEEERQRQGFELQTAFRFAQRNGVTSRRVAEVKAGDQVLGTLTYGDTATLWRVNLGRRRRADDHQLGFLLDITRGYWAKADADDDGNDDDPTGPRLRRVIPFVEDNRNLLLYEPAQTVPVEVMASLAAALKQAIQVVFQLEDDELAVEPLPTSTVRRQLLFFESAEGGAGVLRRLVDEPDALARVARKALEVCHYDPDHGTDLGPLHGDGCEAACYDCLLSYRNQPDHQLLDRRAALPVLQTLTGATVQVSATGVDRPYGEHADHLVTTADSELEQEFIRFLAERNLHLPEEHHRRIDAAMTEPDFLYPSEYVAVYVDGPAHQYPDRQRRDAERDEALRDLGWTVLRFGHKDDWAQIIDSHRWVFGEVV